MSASRSAIVSAQPPKVTELGPQGDATAGLMNRPDGVSFVASARFVVTSPFDSYRVGLTALGLSLTVVGDLNCDGNVDFGDINPFVLRLTNPAGYQAVYPSCPDANGDINGNGSVGLDDINPFVALLIN